MEISLKNLLLAGIGTAAYSYEKGKELIDELVKKGEITVKQGKELNEELKKKIDEKKENNPLASLSAEAAKKIVSQLNLATKQDIEDLKKRLDQIESK